LVAKSAVVNLCVRCSNTEELQGTDIQSSGAQQQPVYNVRFCARELLGRSGEPVEVRD
jgi:hypothetical protein